MAEELLRQQQETNSMLTQILKDTQSTLKAQSELFAKQEAKIDKLERNFQSMMKKKDVNSPTFNMESLANMMDTFTYDPESGSTFEKWYEMYSEIFSESNLDDKARIQLLLLKLEPVSSIVIRSCP